MQGRIQDFERGGFQYPWGQRQRVLALSCYHGHIEGKCTSNLIGTYRIAPQVLAANPELSSSTKCDNNTNYHIGFRGWC